MNLNEALKKKVTDYFVSKHGCAPYANRGWYKGYCPQCGKFKFGFRLSDNRVNCFHCGPMGTPLKAIMEIEQLDTLPQVYHFLRTFEGIDYYEGPKKKDTFVKTITLPESFKLLSIGKTEMGKLARDYMRKRGFNPWTLSTMGVGYCTSGDNAGMIILPFYRQGRLVYYIGRRYMLFGINKFDNPDAEQFGIGKTELIFNEDALQVYSTVYIVESVINALTIGPSAISIQGKKISPIQLSKILRSPCKRIVICLDPDAWTEAIQLGFKLVEYKQVKVIKFPENKDVNNLGRKWVIQTKKETPYHSYMDLIRLKAA